MAEGQHHILFYDYVEDMGERRAPHRDAHLAHLKGAKDAGHVVLAGALGDPPHGAAIVFKIEDTAEIERFADEDPYVKAGLVTGRRIERWMLV